MICNDDRILPVAREDSSAAAFFANASGARKSLPAFFRFSCTEPAEPSTKGEKIGNDELSAALGLLLHVLRYDPAWKTKRTHDLKESRATNANSCKSSERKSDVLAVKFVPRDAQGAGSRLAAKNSCAADALRSERQSAFPAKHTKQSPQAMIETLTKDAWEIDLAHRKEANEKRAAPKPAELTELQYLVAYNLVNNFYFNLVSWSPIKRSIAIAIDQRTYWWNGSGVVEDIAALHKRKLPVLCILCSLQGHFAVASLDGVLCVYSVTRTSEYLTQALPAPVFTITWFPDGVHLLVGDSRGQIAIMKFVEGKSLEVVSLLCGFTQQICGFALNSTCTEAAAGANENLAIVWDISNLKKPLIKCRLKHTSAVKGILFCPWAPGLLATGGGSNDRHLRYWHTGSGRMLGEVNTQRQITAVFWCSRKKEVLVTYGYLACESHVVAAIFPYPGQEPIAEARSREALRALSALMAPDETSVAIAANDGTVRVYNLWDKGRALAAAGRGCYGSGIIETVEGIDVPPVWR